MTLMELLNRRYQFEEITKSYNLDRGSDIDSIEWFIENGHRSNSLRNGFKEAKNIAEKIKEYADGCTKEIRKRKSVREI